MAKRSVGEGVSEQMSDVWKVEMRGKRWVATYNWDLKRQKSCHRHPRDHEGPIYALQCGNNLKPVADAYSVRDQG